jgi:hypothetical protein
MLVPVAISGFAYVGRYKHFMVSIAAVLMLAWVVLGIMSVGSYYFPSLVLLIVAIFRRPKENDGALSITA